MLEKSCKSCWWQEGGRCYEGNFSRDSKGYSKKLAKRRCEKYWSKRDALSTLIPSKQLIISSENNREGK